MRSPLCFKCLKYSQSPFAPVTITLTLLVCQIHFSLSLNLDVLKTFLSMTILHWTLGTLHHVSLFTCKPRLMLSP